MIRIRGSSGSRSGSGSRIGSCRSSKVLHHFIPTVWHPLLPYFPTPMHLASSSPLEANLCPVRVNFCVSSTLGKTPTSRAPLIDEPRGSLRCEHLLDHRGPGGWVHYYSRVWPRTRWFRNKFCNTLNSRPQSTSRTDYFIK